MAVDDPNEVYELMLPGHPYTASEIAALIGEYHVAAKRALQTLLEEERVWKKRHTERASCYGIPTDCVHGLEGGQVLDMTDEDDAAAAVAAASDTDPDALSAPSD